MPYPTPADLGPRHMSAVMPNPGSNAAPAVAAAVPPRPVPTGQTTQPALGVASAAERLAHSREQIRESMSLIARPSPRVSVTGQPLGSGSMLDPLVDRVLELPGVNLVIATLQSWWKHHPWRAVGLVGLVAADAGREAVAPIAKRHPVYLMLGAALFGALLLRWGPWRWVAKRTLVAGFVPLLATRIAANVPLESWLSALTILRRPKTRSEAPRG